MSCIAKAFLGASLRNVKLQKDEKPVNDSFTNRTTTLDHIYQHPGVPPTDASSSSFPLDDCSMGEVPKKPTRMTMQKALFSPNFNRSWADGS